MSGSQIARIVDYTAAVAARIQNVALPNGTVVGVRAIYGAGQNVYGDPLRPGQYIQPAPALPLEPFSHMSELPDAPTVVPVTQTGTVQFGWVVPMRLYVPLGDFAAVRQTLLPFYAAYASVFTPDWTLGGLCLISSIKSFTRGVDANWAWLDVELDVIEQVSF